MLPGAKVHPDGARAAALTLAREGVGGSRQFVACAEGPSDTASRPACGCQESSDSDGDEPTSLQAKAEAAAKKRKGKGTADGMLKKVAYQPSPCLAVAPPAPTSPLPAKLHLVTPPCRWIRACHWARL
jgi:hypothetical protein